MPPSVETEIFTLAALTGAAVVLATSQVTVKGIPPVAVIAVFGAVTRNGPLVPSTVTVIPASAAPPDPALLSRTVTRKFITRAIDGRISPVMQGPALQIAPVGDVPVKVSGGTFALFKM